MTVWTDGFVQANGMNIHYYQTGDSQNPSILLLHGILDSGQCWPVVGRDLAEKFSIVATDARGHGHSSGPDERGMSNEALADDAAAVIQALGLEQSYVFGHSMGAITAATLAARHPELIRALILEDPPLMEEMMIAMFEASQGPGKNPWQPLIDLRTLSREERIARARVMNPKWMEEEIVPWADSKAEYSMDVFATSGKFLRPWREAISPLSCPILLLYGDNDQYAIVAEQVAQDVQEFWTNCQAVHIAGAGHCIHRDKYNETMAAVWKFL